VAAVLEVHEVTHLLSSLDHDGLLPFERVNLNYVGVTLQFLSHSEFGFGLALSAGVLVRLEHLDALGLALGLADAVGRVDLGLEAVSQEFVCLVEFALHVGFNQLVVSRRN